MGKLIQYTGEWGDRDRENYEIVQKKIKKVAQRLRTKKIYTIQERKKPKQFRRHKSVKEEQWHREYKMRDSENHIQGGI